MRTPPVASSAIDKVASSGVLVPVVASGGGPLGLVGAAAVVPGALAGCGPDDADAGGTTSLGALENGPG